MRISSFKLASKQSSIVASLVAISLVLCNALSVGPALAEAESDQQHLTISRSPELLARRKQASPNTRKTIALAMGGGGIRGATKIGVLRVLEREKIPVDYIVGTSMGAIVGSLYASGVSLDKIEQLLLDRRLQKAYAPRPLFVQVALQPFMIVAHLFKGRPACGLYSGNALEKFLRKQVPSEINNIEDLPVKFIPVVTNLCDGQLYGLKKGSLCRAVRASASIPMFIRPVAS